MSAALTSGGYFVGRHDERHGAMSPDLLPARLISASDCIMAHAPHTWAIRWTGDSPEQRAEAAAGFGLDAEGLRRATAWATAALEPSPTAPAQLGWPDVFFELAAARRFRAECLPPSDEIVVFGVALPTDLCPAFIAAPAPAPGAGAPGVYDAIAAGRAPAPGGVVLGFEVLGWDGWGFHSAACNGLERDFRDQLGVTPGPHGFPTDAGDARRCAEHAGRPTTGAEPGLWQPWRITLYPPG